MNRSRNERNRSESGSESGSESETNNPPKRQTLLNPKQQQQHKSDSDQDSSEPEPELEYESSGTSLGSTSDRSDENEDYESDDVPESDNSSEEGEEEEGEEEEEDEEEENDSNSNDSTDESESNDVRPSRRVTRSQNAHKTNKPITPARIESIGIPVDEQSEETDENPEDENPEEAKRDKARRQKKDALNAEKRERNAANKLEGVLAKTNHNRRRPKNKTFQEDPNDPDFIPPKHKPKQTPLPIIKKRNNGDRADFVYDPNGMDFDTDPVAAFPERSAATHTTEMHDNDVDVSDGLNVKADILDAAAVSPEQSAAAHPISQDELVQHRWIKLYQSKLELDKSYGNKYLQEKCPAVKQLLTPTSEQNTNVNIASRVHECQNLLAKMMTQQLRIVQCLTILEGRVTIVDVVRNIRITFSKVFELEHDVYDNCMKACHDVCVHLQIPPDKKEPGTDGATKAPTIPTYRTLVVPGLDELYTRDVKTSDIIKAINYALDLCRQCIEELHSTIICICNAIKTGKTATTSIDTESGLIAVAKLFSDTDLLLKPLLDDIIAMTAFINYGLGFIASEDYITTDKLSANLAELRAKKDKDTADSIRNECSKVEKDIQSYLKTFAAFDLYVLLSVIQIEPYVNIHNGIVTSRDNKPIDAETKCTNLFSIPSDMQVFKEKTSSVLTIKRDTKIELSKFITACEKFDMLAHFDVNRHTSLCHTASVKLITTTSSALLPFLYGRLQQIQALTINHDKNRYAPHYDEDNFVYMDYFAKIFVHPVDRYYSMREHTEILRQTSIITGFIFRQQLGHLHCFNVRVVPNHPVLAVTRRFTENMVRVMIRTSELKLQTLSKVEPKPHAIFPGITADSISRMRNVELIAPTGKNTSYTISDTDYDAITIGIKDTDRLRDYIEGRNAYIFDKFGIASNALRATELEQTEGRRVRDHIEGKHAYIFDKSGIASNARRATELEQVLPPRHTYFYGIDTRKLLALERTKYREYVVQMTQKVIAWNKTNYPKSYPDMLKLLKQSYTDEDVGYTSTRDATSVSVLTKHYTARNQYEYTDEMHRFNKITYRNLIAYGITDCEKHYKPFIYREQMETVYFEKCDVDGVSSAKIAYNIQCQYSHVLSIVMLVRHLNELQQGKIDTDVYTSIYELATKVEKARNKGAFYLMVPSKLLFGAYTPAALYNRMVAETGSPMTSTVTRTQRCNNDASTTSSTSIVEEINDTVKQSVLIKQQQRYTAIVDCARHPASVTCEETYEITEWPHIAWFEFKCDDAQNDIPTYTIPEVLCKSGKEFTLAAIIEIDEYARFLTFIRQTKTILQPCIDARLSATHFKIIDGNVTIINHRLHAVVYVLPYMPVPRAITVAPPTSPIAIKHTKTSVRYMCAVFQCLAATTNTESPQRDELVTRSGITHIGNKSCKFEHLGLPKYFKKMMMMHASSTDTVKNLSEDLIYAFSDGIHDVYDARDAGIFYDDFIRRLLDLDCTCASPVRTELTTDMCTTGVCECGTIIDNETYETRWSVKPLGLRSNKTCTLEESIVHYFDNTTVKCDFCGIKVSIKRRVAMYPKFLVVQIDRTDMSNTQRGTAVSFQQLLMHNGVRFDLFGVVKYELHDTLNTDYASCCRYNDTWYTFDGSNKAEVKLDTVKLWDKRSYLLFYRNADWIEPVLTELAP